MYVFGCGFVWLVLQLIYFTITDAPIRLDEVTILYGLLTGALLVSANILLIESLTGLDVSLGSMIYRLNTIGVVVMSFMLLAEDVGFIKVLGIGIGIAAILILYTRADDGNAVSIPILFFVMAVAASAFSSDIRGRFEGCARAGSGCRRVVSNRGYKLDCGRFRLCSVSGEACSYYGQKSSLRRGIRYAGFHRCQRLNRSA